MKTLFPYFFAIILAGAAAADEPAAARPADWAQPVKLEGLPNLHQVSKTLYRCAQPEDKSAKSINSLGIRTVVNLRAFHSDEDELEGVTAKQVHIKMKTWHAEHENMVKFLKIAIDPKQAPVLVHCQHGADRTGTACAMYRVVVQGWTKEEAIREMTEGGYGFHEVWKNLPDWIKDLNVEAMRKEVGIKDITPISPPSGPAADSFNGLHLKSKFLAILPQTPTPAGPNDLSGRRNQDGSHRAPEGCDGLKILPHIPHIDDDNPLTRDDYMAFKDRVLVKLERMGLTDLRKHVVFEHCWTPVDIREQYFSNKGSIYGVVSDRFKNLAFKAPKQSTKYPNLFFVGGSVNPGGGMPMVVLCGQNVAKNVVAWDRQ